LPGEVKLVRVSNTCRLYLPGEVKLVRVGHILWGVDKVKLSVSVLRVYR